MSENINGWNEWSKYVLKELERLNNCYEKLEEKITDSNNRLENKIVKLTIEFEKFQEIMKIKSGIWGLLGGLIPVVLALSYLLIRK